MTRLHLRRGAATEGAFELVVTPERAGWEFTGLRILVLDPGDGNAFDTGENELIVLPLAGGCSVTADGEGFTLAGRNSVFSELSHFVYLPRHVDAGEVAAELRGAGQASRQVNNFCSPEAFVGDRLIAVEVLTPAGKLVFLSAAQARRGPAGRGDGARGDLLLRSGCRADRGGLRLPALLRGGRRPRDRRARRGPHWRRGAAAARLSRAIDGSARL
jgi:5-deoxy-D-glucuronate isomerase